MSAAAGTALRVPFGALALDYREKRAAIDAAIARVLERGWFVLGEEVAAFEAAFAKFLGVSHVVACANGTEAIALALRALGAGPEDEVVLPGEHLRDRRSPASGWPAPARSWPTSTRTR